MERAMVLLRRLFGYWSAYHCPACRGLGSATGIVPDHRMPCAVCRGTGKRRSRSRAKA
jgi:hypothetical protein